MADGPADILAGEISESDNSESVNREVNNVPNADNTELIKDLMSMMLSTLTTMGNNQNRATTTETAFEAVTIEVGTYSGADQEDPEDFFARFTKAADEYKMEAHLRKTALLRCLTGEAKNYYERNRPKLHNVKAIQEAILKRFNGDSARANLLYKFCATKLANLDEDCDTFLTTQRDIWRRINPEASESMSIQVLYRQLDNAIQRDLEPILNNIRSVEDLIDTASRIQEGAKRRRGDKKGNISPPYVPPYKRDGPPPTTRQGNGEGVGAKGWQKPRPQ